MDLGCNMFTYKLNGRRHHRRGRMYMNNPTPSLYNNLQLNYKSRLPAALGRSMYSTPKDGGCGCGK